MVISIKDVEHVALLARLALSDAEKQLYAEQLSRIIEHFHELASIDTTGVEPMAHALPVTNVLRDDQVVAFACRESLLANAPAREGAYIKVPRIGE